MRYIPGIEIDIANKIVEASACVTKTVVNMTGGEPLLVNAIRETIEILGSAEHIDIQLITNFLLVEKIADILHKVSKVILSLHIQCRNSNGIDTLIDLINSNKVKTKIVLTQVDHNLSFEDRENLNYITRKTGLAITFQTYIPPWTREGKIENSQKIQDANFVASFGKRCSLGYTYFYINPDGTFYYDLWCKETSRKIGNFLEPLSVNQHAFFPSHMKKCPSSSCGCNYNIFNYDEYLAVCKRLGYAKKEIFGRRNISVSALLKRMFSVLGNRHLLSMARKYRQA